MIATVFSALKALILTILNVFRRGYKLIIERRRRHPSYDNDSNYPLLDSVVSTVPGGGGGGENGDNWDDSWTHEDSFGSKKELTVTDHIAAYRESLLHQKSRNLSSASSNHELNHKIGGNAAGGDNTTAVEDMMFAELAPTSIKQKKIYVGPKEKERNRLSISDSAANVDPFMYRSDKLEDWNDDADEGWEATNEEDIKKIIKEQKYGQKTAYS